MKDLKEMSVDELKALLDEVKKEIAARQPEPQLVLYEHGCKASATYHLNKYKHWSKLVTGVDTAKTNGYAFQGEFLSVRNEHKVPVGSIIVEVCNHTITAYEAFADGFEFIGSANTRSMSGLIEKVAEKF